MFIEDTLYREILNVMPIPTVDILFLSLENKILLGKRDNEPLPWIYYIPGGRVNKWETSLETAKRKAKEELGIDIDVKKLSIEAESPIFNSVWYCPHIILLFHEITHTGCHVRAL